MPANRYSRRTVLGIAGAAGAAGVVGITTPASAGRRRRPATVPPTSPALIVHNASLWTGAGPLVTGGGLAVGRDGTILAVGADADLLVLSGRDTEHLDADGATVMPGIHDLHMHPLAAGEAALDYSLDDADLTTDELLAAVQSFLDDSADQEPDGWLAVQNWNPTGPSDNVAHKRFLDTLATARPIVLSGSDGHNSWVNSRALELAGITASTPQPAGGEIVMDADGPTGLLKESGQDPVYAVIPERSEGEIRRAQADAFALMASLGITAFLDAAGSADSIDAYAALAGDGKLLQRALVNFAVPDELLTDPADALEAAIAARGDHAGHRLAVPSIKVFMDGVVEFPAQTAALLAPYLSSDGKPADYAGSPYLSSTEMAALCTAFDAAGWQVHTHAIGDAAVRVTLDGYEAALAANPGGDRRHAIAHVQLVDAADLGRFAATQTIACMQLQWAVRDEYTVDAVEPYIGPERMATMYPAGAIAAAGGLVSGGSDWPVDTLNPWNQIQTAIDRIGEFSTYGDPLEPQHALDLEAALQMHTVNSAFQGHLDEVSGTLEPGRAADFVVLDRDLHQIDVAEIHATSVRYTFVEGAAVHDESASAGGFRRGLRAPAPALTRHHRCCGGHG